MTYDMAAATSSPDWSRNGHRLCGSDSMDPSSDAPPIGSQPRPKALELDEFLALDVPDHDWLIPDIIERGDRVIITATEGGGKSTLLRQIGVQSASGLHPFGGDPYTPLRVLLIDLENSARQVHRKIRPLRLSAGDDYAASLFLHVRPQGLDLLDSEDVVWLRDLSDEVQPDVVITGPLYRLAGGDPTEERTAKAVSAQLDGLRARHGCALILEAHTPYGSNGGKRPERPYGASLWSRWPEFGIYLDSDTGQLRHWRGARDERDWPAVLKRGGEWPWTAVTTPRDVVWARVVDECSKAGERLPLRELEKRLKEPYQTIRRATKDHAELWEAMA